MKKVVLIATFLTIIATPALAQSCDPAYGTGNAHGGCYGSYYGPYAYYRWRAVPYSYGYAHPYRYYGPRRYYRPYYRPYYRRYYWHRYR